MSDLKHSSSAPTPNSRLREQLARSSTASRAALRLSVFSAQHLDDNSDYHGGDHDSRLVDEDNNSEYSDESEQVRNEDYDEAAREGLDEVSEVRGGVLSVRDLEASLEKRQSTRSIKDPNLVRMIDSYFSRDDGMVDWLLIGIMGWPRRPRKSQELDVSTEMGCDDRCILLHFHLACLVVNGGTCSLNYSQRIRRNE